MSEDNVQEVVLCVHHEYQETSLDTQMSDGVTSAFTHLTIWPALRLFFLNQTL